MDLYTIVQDEDTIMKIVLNGAECIVCSEVIFSTHQHDFKTCKCGGTIVDGGNAYLRRGGDTTYRHEANAYDATSDKGGECAGMFLIYSPQGPTPPSTVFCRQQEAMKTAEDMKKKFGGSFYVAGPMVAVK